MTSSRSLGYHFRSTLRLGFPLIIAQVIQMLIGVTDTVMVGWLGSSELAAGTLGFQFFFVLVIFGFGLGAAMMAMLANARGADDHRSVRKIVRMGIWSLFGLSVLYQLPLSFVEPILIFLGQAPDLASIAGSYMVFAQWSMFPVLFVAALRSFLVGHERGNDVLILSLLAVILNIIFNYAFIFGNLGMPRMGVPGAGLATLIANMIVAVLSFVWVLRLPDALPYRLFARFWRFDKPTFLEIFSLGIPIGLMILAEVGMFTATSIMMGWLGTIPLAAHGIALQLASLAFMVPLGLSHAVNVRVGNAAGRGNPDDIARASRIGILLTILFTTFSALVFLLLPEPLISLYLDSANPDAPLVLFYAVPLLYVAAAFQLVDGLQVIASGSLRGLKDTRVPMYIAASSYWLVGLPTGYIFAFVLGYDGIGVWTGLAVGLSLAATLLLRRFALRDRLGLV